MSPDDGSQTLGYVAGISWPRSGHHLMVRLLRAYFGPGFGYCEFHMQKGCCKAFPCVRAGRINLSKNHDFKQATPQVEGLPYLIQFRSFLPSVVSSYELSLGNGGEDSPDAFRRYVSQRWGPYQMFRDKWIQSEFGQRQVILHYETLTDDPVAAMRPATALFAPDRGFDEGKMAQAAREVAGISIYKGAQNRSDAPGVRNRRRLERFRHHDPELFELLERLKLHRRTVLHRWRVKRGGTPPDEDTILRLQTQPDIETLDRLLEGGAGQPDACPERSA